MPFALWHIVGKRSFEFFKPVAGGGTDIINLLKCAFVSQFRGEGEQFVLGRNINLVEHKPFAFRAIF